MPWLLNAALAVAFICILARIVAKARKSRGTDATGLERDNFYQRFEKRRDAGLR